MIERTNFLLTCSYLQFEAFLGDLITDESGHICFDVLIKTWLLQTRKTLQVKIKTHV
jgi:hypothetical protein